MLLGIMFLFRGVHAIVLDVLPVLQTIRAMHHVRVSGQGTRTSTHTASAPNTDTDSASAAPHTDVPSAASAQTTPGDDGRRQMENVWTCEGGDKYHCARDCRALTGLRRVRQRGPCLWCAA